MKFLVKTYLEDSIFITTITDDLTFFDVKEISKDQIVEIYCNSKGEKRYLFKDYVININVNQKRFVDCKMISDEVNTMVQIKGSNKYYISKLLNDQLSNFTQK